MLGTVNPVKLMTAMAHEKGIPVLVDGAQAVAHRPVDVRDIGCDFYAFSGHKVYAPMGIGVLYGKAGRFEAMPPWQGGGDMVKTVSFERTTYNPAPFKFEAGTPNVAGAVGLAVALDELEGSAARRSRRTSRACSRRPWNGSARSPAFEWSGSRPSGPGWSRSWSRAAACRPSTSARGSTWKGSRFAPGTTAASP